MEYEIVGDTLPVVICHLNKGEKMISDSGAMSWMDPCMKMETNGGGAGKIIGRIFSGETLFRNSYTANKDGLIAFASSFPGKIVAIDVEPGKEVIIQKSAFLASEENVETSVFFNKKFSSGIFGGEGFILTKISGHGTCFIEIDGSTVEYNLLPGQQMVIDTGYLAMMDATCKMDIQSVPGLKNKFLGGEGLFNTVVTGPGRIVVQTMPISAVANSLARFFNSANEKLEVFFAKSSKISFRFRFVSLQLITLLLKLKLSPKIEAKAFLTPNSEIKPLFSKISGTFL